MKKIVEWLNDSRYIDPLSPGCKMCAKGSKMVLLITGLCPSNCYYCPLSKEKNGKDRIFADEWELDDEEDVEKLFLEAEYIDAEGAGVTGGDPLFVWERTKKYIEILKNRFGESFHIHLYTSGIKNSEYIDNLVSSGLDEIRFHPPVNIWSDIEKHTISNVIKDSLKQNVDVAIEIPVIPSMKKEIINLITWADKNNISWVNLNELEFSETNAETLMNKGYSVKDDISSAVRNSEKLSYEIIYDILKKDLDIGIHYCSSSFKDGIQLRNRIKRRAKNIVKKHEKITDDGTIMKGIIISDDKKGDIIYNKTKEIFPNDKDRIIYNPDKNRIEIEIEILKRNIDFFKKQGLKCFIIEEYPTADRLEVERIPL